MEYVICRQGTQGSSISFTVYYLLCQPLTFSCFDLLFKEQNPAFLTDWYKLATISFCTFFMVNSVNPVFFTTIFNSDDFPYYFSCTNLTTKLQLRFSNLHWNHHLSERHSTSSTTSPLGDVRCLTSHWICCQSSYMTSLSYPLHLSLQLLASSRYLTKSIELIRPSA